MNGEERLISMLVNNKPGVLSRVAGVFGRLGYNIESLCVAATTNPEISKITLVSKSNSDSTERTKKQLEKLVDVIEVTELGQTRSVQRELILIGIKLHQEHRAEIARAVDIFGCKILSMKSDYYILEVVDNKEKIETVLNYFAPLSIEEIARTGVIALEKEK